MTHLTPLSIETWSDPDARCWIFASPRALISYFSQIRQILDGFLQKWKNETNPLVEGHWQLVRDHFLIVSANHHQIPLSGCSMDSLRKTVDKVGAACEVDFQNRLVYVLDDSNSVRALERPAFKEEIQKGVITEDTIVFDTTIERLGDAANGKFELPLKNSWHKTLFERAVTAKSS